MVLAVYVGVGGFHQSELLDINCLIVLIDGNLLPPPTLGVGGGSRFPSIRTIRH